MQGIKIVFVAAGSAACHSIIGDVEGRCYSWGRNNVRLQHSTWSPSAKPGWARIVLHQRVHHICTFVLPFNAATVVVLPACHPLPVPSKSNTSMSLCTWVLLTCCTRCSPVGR